MSNLKGKVIISCAVTGSIHTPSLSQYLPITPEQITADALGAAEAGAAILHLHARDPDTGRPNQTPEAFMRFIPALRAGTDAILNITTGGSPYNSIEERIRPALEIRPELASLNMGSMNFALFRIAEKVEHFIHDWERDYLLKSRANIFRNTFEDIGQILSAVGANGTRFEFECYDTAHLYNLAYFVDEGLVKPPFFIQTVFGILGGIGTHPDDVHHMKRTADRLFGAEYCWSVLGAGAAQLRIASQAVPLGGNVRVGLEDSIWAGRGRLATSSADQVRMVRQVIEGQGLSVATPAEARAILGLTQP
jgi:uncharacterized protein (DUF849 family)